jgi:hypothetical protein
VDYRFRETMYRIEIEVVGSGETSVELDGATHAGQVVPLVDDGRMHNVRMRISRGRAVPPVS